jgi:nicotinate phosphoribosyltransferase
VAKRAPITGFGVGTSGLDIAYKLCAYGGRGRLKLSTGKPILPGRKQVFRLEEEGRAFRDVIARAEETLPGRPLLRPVMHGGRRLAEAGSRAISCRACPRAAWSSLSLAHARALGTRARGTVLARRIW